MTDDDLADLRRLALAASPGKWHTAPHVGDVYRTGYESAGPVARCRWETDDAAGRAVPHRDAAYIAAAHPAAVLGLLDERDRLRAALAEIAAAPTPYHARQLLDAALEHEGTP